MSEARFRVHEWVLLVIIAWATLTNLALALLCRVCRLDLLRQVLNRQTESNAKWEAAMKTLSTMILAAFTLVALSASTDISGKWEVEANFDDPRIEAGGFDCVVKQEGERLTGRCSDGTASLDGEIDGQKITWRVSNGAQPPATTTFIGTLNASGTAIDGRFTSGTRGGRFVAARI